jgi:hypothetical protein
MEALLHPPWVWVETLLLALQAYYVHRAVRRHRRWRPAKRLSTAAEESRS